MTEKQTEQVIAEQPEELQGEENAPKSEPTGKHLLWISLTALGIVYGDIGTSPLYALRQCFLGEYAIQPSPMNVLGILSLIFWSLVTIISVKYLLYVMRADNHGEGGILALMALVLPARRDTRITQWLLMVLGTFGAALLYGDGMITPAISVLSAIEGLEVATSALEAYVIPLTVIILVCLFALQQRGTSGIGAVFGPVMLVWFVTLAVIGCLGIVRQPDVLVALNPLYAVRFFLHNGWNGFLVLGAIFLVVTGGEALYADMGHFGRRPIRLAWFVLVLPALLVNYFGQGGLLLHNAQAVTNPFYHLAPGWALYPLVILATIATIIASQAIISGAFSLTRQAVLLGELPRLRIVQTSRVEIGQIYIPSVNWVLMLATIGLVISFRRSTQLASAYGVAVTTTMVITTILASVVARERWGWSRPVVLCMTLGFLVVDVAFFGANIIKIMEGGWFPLLIGALVFTLMATWKRGSNILAEQLGKSTPAIETFLQQVATLPPVRVKGTAVVMTGRDEGTPPMLPHHLMHNQVLHERVILLTVRIENRPYVWYSERLEIQELGEGFVRLKVHFGFMQNPDVPRALRMAKKSGLDVTPDPSTYYVGHLTVIPTKKHPGMALWREKLFVFMSRNAAESIAFFHLPPERVIEVGLRIEI